MLCSHVCHAMQTRPSSSDAKHRRNRKRSRWAFRGRARYWMHSARSPCVRFRCTVVPFQAEVRNNGDTFFVIPIGPERAPPGPRTIYRPRGRFVENIFNSAEESRKAFFILSRVPFSKCFPFSSGTDRASKVEAIRAPQTDSLMRGTSCLAAFHCESAD